MYELPYELPKELRLTIIGIEEISEISNKLGPKNRSIEKVMFSMVLNKSVCISCIIILSFL